MGRSKIVAVAIKHKEVVYQLPAPNRHHNVIANIVENTGATYVDGEQGFIDEEGRFLNRKQALVSAIVNGQVKDESKIRHNMLFSEDLW